jgi:hypothetical protein
MSLYVGDRLVCRFGWSSIQTCTPDGHLHRVTYTRCRINIIYSSDDEHKGAQNVENWNKYIYTKKIVLQIGCLEEMNRDGRSTKHKIP